MKTPFICACILALPCLATSTATTLPDCPCIAPTFNTSTYWRGGSELLIPTSSGLYVYPGSEVYGSYCDTWTSRITGFCQGDDTDEANGCEDVYCYVDPSNCSTASYPSTYFRGMDIQYSYLTCGDQSSQDDFVAAIRNQLDGATVRFAYPAESRPWHYLQDGRWSGSVATFFQDLEVLSKFRAQEHSVSDASLNLFPSPWDACVHDVRMDLIDVCVSVVMETDTRREMAAFTSPIKAGSMKLMVPKETKDDRWDPSLGYDSAWFSFLKPFGPMLWLLLLALVFFAGGAYHWTDEGADKSWGLCFKHTFTSACHRGTVAFFAGGDLGDSRTKAGACIRVGFTIFAMIMIASYTANLAQLLVVDAENAAGIQSIADCDPPSDLCGKVCVLTQQLNLVRAQHPTMEVVTTPSSLGLIEMLAAGECDASIAPEHDALARADFQAIMCENRLHFVGDAIFQVYVGFAARGDLVNALSYYTLQMVYQGEFERRYEQFRFKQIDTCLDGESTGDEEEGTLTATDMAGVCILFAAFIVLSIVAHSIDICRKRAKGRRASGLVVTGDADVDSPDASIPAEPVKPIPAHSVV
mmetsp:Transcript_73096/g.136618  ORF Transcript_73096/g.136618 Transcript_73096/m.136618 type:complete len:583 (-) Transcript_73096:11-1759(-)